MQPLFYVLAIMGCGDGQAQCAQVRTEPVRYESMLQCQVAMPDALRRNSGLDYPELTAACRAIGEQMADAKPARRG